MVIEEGMASPSSHRPLLMAAVRPNPGTGRVWDRIALPGRIAGEGDCRSATSS